MANEELYTALKNADAAGDTAGAQKIAAYIQSLPKQETAPVPERSIKQEVGHQAMNLAGGLLRGAGSIGATIARPFETGEENDQRRARLDENARDLLGADTSSWLYKGGKLGGEIAGTAGVGGVLAKGAMAIPYLAKAAPAVIDAIGTSGMSANGATGLGGVAARATGGAVTGGASAGLVNPEDAGTGAVIGAAAPGVIQLAGKAGGAVSNFVKGTPPTPDMVAATNAARGAGYVIPPTQVKPSLGNRLLEGYAGKLTTAQNASAKNAEITNNLAATEIGLRPGAQITPEALADIRKNAGTAYKNVSDLPSRPSYDESKQEFLAKISKAKSEKETALQAAGKLQSFAAQQNSLAHGRDIKLAVNQPENQLYYNTGSLGRTATSPSSLPVPGYPRIPGRYTNNIDRVSEGNQGAGEAMEIFATKRAEETSARQALASFETEAGKLPTKEAIDPSKMVFDLRQARNDADAWYKSYGRTADPTALAKAKAAKEKATELQKTLEGYAQSLGRSDLVDDMVKARQLIAKTYSVEKALNPTTGTVDAKKLGAQLDKGKPLSGGLREAAEFANRFPKAANTPERMGSLPQNSPLDYAAGGAMSIAHGNVLPLIGAIAGRPMARSAALSNLVQNRLTQQPGNSRLSALLRSPDAQQALLRSAPIVGAQ